MTTIKEFFKKKAAPSQESVTIDLATGEDEKKLADSKPAVVEDEDFQTFRRSTKSLVKGRGAKANVVRSPKISKKTSPKASTKVSPNKQASPNKAAPVKVASPRPSPKKRSAPASPKRTPAKAKAQTDDDEAFEEPAKKTPAKKPSNFREYLARKNAVPAALGSKEIPIGAPGCFSGQAFLFTGDLSSMTRDQAQDLVKRYSGRVVAAPSKKTNWVVVGANPGPSKMEKIAQLGIQTVDEDGFLDMLRASNPDGQQFDEDPVNRAAFEAAPSAFSAKKLEAARAALEEHVDVDERTSSASTPSLLTHREHKGSDLWTDKYAPRAADELIGNPGIYEKLLDWLNQWNSPASDQPRAALLSGPPGIGKTTMSQLVCRELGLQSIEMNASDTRNKKTLHDRVRELIDNRCIGSSFFKGHHKKAKEDQTETSKPVLVMDEVDGMSAGDRGGMAELILLIKKTRIPIICICNDRSSPKVRSLANHCLDLRLRRPDARQALPRLQAIAEKEGIKIQPNALEELLMSTHGDIRQLLTLLSTFSLTKDTLGYDQSKAITLSSAKDIEQGPFDAVGALLGGASWDRMTLGQRIDQYFIDSSLVPLMVQENYLKAKANTPRTIAGSTRPANFLDLAAAAADALSLSERPDSLIRGANQEWSLAPFHGFMSSVLPAYYVHGTIGGRIEFASWLGQNSRAMKHTRLLTEVTHHAFFRTHTGRLELRMDYVGPLCRSVMDPLIKSGQDGIEQAINVLDDYCLSRDDLDTLLTLSLDPDYNLAAFSARIPTAVRSAFTRRYNQGSHRLPYSLGGPSGSVKRVAGGPAAEAQEDEEEEADIIYGGDDLDAVDDGSTGEDDVTKDKNIKAKKVSTKRPAAGASSSGAKRGRGGKK